jgi:tetratricopeptide (TPR) repeat protein
MKKFGLIFLANFFLVLAPGLLCAQSDDPSESFLKAYMTAQQGEKLEHEGQFKAALAKYRFAGSLLEQLRKTHGDWQPAIVEYRSRKVSENILRVQGKASTQEDLATGPAPLPNAAPILPEQSGAPEPSIEIAEPRTTPPPAQLREVAKAPSPPPPAPAPTPNDAAIREATKKLQSRVDQLQAELEKSRDQFGAVEKEKEALDGKLKESTAKLEKAQGELDKTKVAEKKVRDQLADAQESLKKVQSTTGTDSKAQESLRAEIAHLKKTLASVERGRSDAEKERDDATAKVTATDKQVANMAKERDDAVARLAGSKDAQKRVDTLITENSDLKQKLASAEKNVRDLSDEKPKKEQELAEVKKQIGDLQQQLAASQKQNKEYETKVVDLGRQLDEASKQIEQAKLVGATAEETSRLTKENEILRNIVVRERQEEARRDQAKKLMLAEFDKLKIKSDTLTEQIQLLAQPVTKLTDEELALLRQPIVSISDNNPAALKASFTYAKKSGNTPVTITGPDGKPTTEQSESSEEVKANTPPGNFHPNVPDDLVGMAREAKENFDKGKYRTAEKLYQEILTKSPNNLYSISNLGVVYFRTGKLKAAELTLKKAVALAPKDEFSHTTLGIVYYRQAKFDEALAELTKSLAINPKSATAHNYLGITASQKGWQEAAEKEMLEAIADNPEYADAHFNLAVIYATATPPARELAKRHYTRATSLGAQPDPSLEKLLR